MNQMNYQLSEQDLEQHEYERGLAPVRESNQDFMQWLFSFKEQVIIPLEKTWRGYTVNERNEWVAPKNKIKLIMNEKGISWAVSFVASFINPVFVVSNFDETNYNFRMQQVVRVVFNKLKVSWKEFDMQKTDIQRVAEEIESKVSAILLGARSDGYRKFFATGRSVQEVRHHNVNSFDQSGNGMFNLGKKFFKRNTEMYG